MYVDPPGICWTECGDESLAKALFFASAETKGRELGDISLYLMGELTLSVIINTPTYYNRMNPRVSFRRVFGSIDPILSVIKNFDGHNHLSSVL